MSLFKGLFIYKRARVYDTAKSRKDSRLNVGHDYMNDRFITRMLSNHITRNQTMRDFLLFIDDYLFNLIKGVRTLKAYKNYTVKKDDKYVR